MTSQANEHVDSGRMLSQEYDQMVQNRETLVKEIRALQTNYDQVYGQNERRIRQ